MYYKKIFTSEYKNNNTNKIIDKLTLHGTYIFIKY